MNLFKKSPFDDFNYQKARFGIDNNDFFTTFNEFANKHNSAFNEMMRKEKIELPLIPDDYFLFNTNLMKKKNENNNGIKGIKLNELSDIIKTATSVVSLMMAVKNLKKKS